MAILNTVLEKSFKDVHLYFRQSDFIVDDEEYENLFIQINTSKPNTIINDLSKRIRDFIYNNQNITSILFYYFLKNLYISKHKISIKMSSLTSIYNLFLILVERYSQVTLFEYTMTDISMLVMNQYLELFGLVDEMLYSYRDIKCDQTGCHKISNKKESIHRVPLAVQQGGDEEHYTVLKEILEKSCEPRHDFSKERNEYPDIRKFFNKSYKGSLDHFDEEYDRLSDLINEFIKEGNPFYEIKSIDFDKISKSDNFETSMFSYFHNFISFSQYPNNSSPQLFKYVSLKNSNSLTIVTPYNLDNSDFKPGVYAIDVFREVELFSNNIRYHMDDITPTGSVKSVYDIGDNEIISAASIWDPNSKNTLRPGPKFPSITNTFLEIPDVFPKRSIIQSGNIRLQWSVSFNLDQENPLQLVVTSIVGEKKKQYSALLYESIGVAELTKLMFFVENGVLPEEHLDRNTEIIFDKIIKPIRELAGALLDDKKSVLFSLLLDFKKTGDWGQINWIDNYNKSDPVNKCMLVTKDKLCGLEAILVGIPTLVSNQLASKTEKMAGLLKGETGTDKIAKLLGNFNFVLYKGKTGGITSGYINGILRGCYAKLTPDYMDSMYPLLKYDYFSRQFPVVNIFFGADNFKSLLQKFNENVVILKGFINEADPENLSIVIDTAPYTTEILFSIVENMETFCNLISELEFYLKNVNNIQSFIESAFTNSVMLLGWFLSSKSLEDIEKELKGEASTSVRRSGRSENVLQLILETPPEKICKLKFKKIQRANEENTIKLIFFTIGNLYNQIYSSNIKSLFGSIYCKKIDNLNYLSEQYKETLKQKLISTVFEPREIESQGDLVEKLKKVIAIIECILDNKEEEFVDADSTSTNTKLVEKIRFILSEMASGLESADR